MHRRIIKETRSLSPLSGAVVPAQIIAEGGAIYLLKQDEEGREYQTLVERDPEFYRRASRHQPVAQIYPHLIHLFISARCNLNCPVCYEHKDAGREPSLDEIARMTRPLSGRFITLMGREPTCRQDLLEIIRLVKPRNNVTLLTNGIKLAEYDYVKGLKRSGLDVVTLSFNGFEDSIYEALNGQALLETKLRALDNLKRVGLKTILSATIARGINDHQIRRLCEFCLHNRSYIYELRIRSISPVGRHLPVEQYCMSELVDLVAGALDLRQEDLIKEQEFRQLILEKLGPLIPAFLRDYLLPRLCSFSFHIQGEQAIKTLCHDLDLERLGRPGITQHRLIWHLLRTFGLPYVLENLSVLLRIPMKKRSQNIMVVLKCWPNLMTIDLQEDHKCPSLYLKDGEATPFCRSNILQSCSRDQHR